MLMADNKHHSCEPHVTDAVPPEGTSMIVELTDASDASKVIVERTGWPFTIKIETLPGKAACQCIGFFE